MIAHSGQTDYILTFTVPFVWNLACFSVIVQLVQNYVTLLTNDEELCKHNVYCSFCMELDLLL